MGEELALRGNRRWSFQSPEQGLQSEAQARRFRSEVEVRTPCGVRSPPLRHRCRPRGAPAAPITALVAALLLLSHRVVSRSLPRCGRQHAGLPCPSLSPGACSDSDPVESVMPSNCLILLPPAPHDGFIGTFSCA